MVTPMRRSGPQPSRTIVEAAERALAIWVIDPKMIDQPDVRMHICMRVTALVGELRRAWPRERVTAELYRIAELTGVPSRVTGGNPGTPAERALRDVLDESLATAATG
jgi:hypothetical protein